MWQKIIKYFARSISLLTIIGIASVPDQLQTWAKWWSVLLTLDPDLIQLIVILIAVVLFSISYDMPQNFYKKYIKPQPLKITFKQGIRPFCQKIGNRFIYRIVVTNTGKKTIKNVRVKLNKLSPASNELTVAPCFLVFMNDEEPYKGTKDLEPVASKNDGQPWDIIIYDEEKECPISICHVVRIVPIGASHLFQSIRKQFYKLQIIVSSDNGGNTVTKTITFDPNKDPKNRMEIN